MLMDTVTVQDLAAYLREPTGLVQLVDVREPQELALSQLPGFINLPLSEYEQWSTMIESILNFNQETWVICHHGLRSAQMCQWLEGKGYQIVKNITGGIHAYALEIDRSVPLY
ncbi:hypothetical protein AMR42_13830 [Limnothrix sp. PR1529]|nr:hypothetical protein BCR12_15480 [Limnothrix sp. P13C2]PIB08198.1 hypothetical protein AMR42_13830 [Limnothrix sp. PR1529]